MSATDTVLPPPAARLFFGVPVDEPLRRYLPRRLRAPTVLPTNAPIPRIGERVHLTSISAWDVVLGPWSA